MSTDETPTAEADLAALTETVVLLVLARERPAVARALLTAAAEAGVDPWVVRTVSDGFAVPRHLAELAGLVLADDAEPSPGRPPAFAAALDAAPPAAPVDAHGPEAADPVEGDGEQLDAAPPVEAKDDDDPPAAPRRAGRKGAGK